MTIKGKLRRIKKTWNSFDNWPAIPKIWAKIKLILKPMLIVTGLLLTFVPVYFEQESLIRVYNGILIPDGLSSIDLNFSDPTSVHIVIPYKIENNGFYDLHEISIKVSLELDYTHKDTGEKRSKFIISARGNQGFARVGEKFQSIYSKNFLDFDWRRINEYLSEVNESQPTSVLMDVEFSFFLAGVEHDWIYFYNKNLTSDAESANTSYQNLKLSPKSSPSFQVIRLSFLDIILIFFSIFLFLLVLWVRKAKKDKPKSVNVRKIIKKQTDPAKKRQIFISFRKITIYTIIVVIWDIILLIETSNSNIYNTQYEIRYLIAVINSIILMVLINVNSLLPSLKPLKFKKYSANEGIRSLLSSVLTLAILLVWTSTSLISYELNNNVIMVRDTFPSFVPIIILAGINIGIKSFDLINLKIFHEEYRELMLEEEKLLRKKPYKALSKSEFNKILLLAIKKINKIENIATVSKIKSYFRQRRISTTTDFGPKVNQIYLNSLVDKNFLEIKKMESKGGDGKNIVVFFTTLKAEDLILNSGHKTDELNGGIEEGVFFDKRSIALIECPNLECRYSCNPVWIECPICFTELDVSRNCKICGEAMLLAKDDNSICANCSELDSHSTHEIYFCPKCGTETFSREKYCIACYFPFSQPSEKFWNFNLDKLYKMSLLYERISKFLIVFMFQFFLLVFIIIDFSNFYGLNIEYNIYYSLIIGLILALLIIYFQLKLIQIRKERIVRDKLYRVKLSVIRYKAELVEKIGEYQGSFRSVNNTIIKLMRKIRFWSKILALLKYFSILILIFAITLIFWNYVISIILVIIDLSFAYVFVYNIKVQYINDIFRLATRFDEGLYEDFVIYAIKQIDYL